MTQKTRQRGFEIITKYKGKEINLPVRKTKYSAGYDIESAETVVVPSVWRQVGKFLDDSRMKDYDATMEFINKELKTKTIEDIMKEFKLQPTLIPTGIKAYMLDDEVLKLFNRSGNPMKMGLIMGNSTGIIDKDYHNNPGNEGHIYAQFLNFLPFEVTIKKGEAMCQGIFEKYLAVDDDIAEGERLSGFGSTGK